MDDSAIEARARSLIDAHSPDVKSCIRQPTIYDTAWVAMLSRSIDDGSPEWVFPDSFQFLLDHQKLNGGWATSESKLDNILNTLAATLALKRHYGSSLKANQIHAAASLGSRVSKAERFLQREMSDWEPELSSHTGFEILIPALLSMLEDEGITLHFAGRQRLMKLKQEFFAKFDLQNLYKSENSSILYFLEAFLGLGDFERLGLHKARGSIMRSPSSTAAYLIGLRLWDTDCEACIRTAIQATGVPGGVPSVFPPKPVEFATIWATLLNSDLVTDYRSKYESASVMSTIEVGTDMAMTYNGFENLTTEDLLADLLLGKICSSKDTTNHLSIIEQRLIRQVEIHGANFDTGCRILVTLLRQPRVSDDNHHIFFIANLVCDFWWTGKAKGGQNLSPLYPMMLFVEAFSEMHRILQSEAPASKVWDRGLIAIAQILGKILSMQNNDGSWGPRECAETTAYALLSLVAIKNIPFMDVMKEEIRYAINRGRQAMSLMHDKWAEPHHLWVEKVAYGCTGLSEAYSLAAMKKSNEYSLYNQNERTSETKQAQKILTFAKYFSGCDHLMKMPLSVIKLSVIEGYCYQSGLKALRTQVFPKTQAKERDKYLDYIPIMWTLASNSRHLSSPPEYLFDMMVLSMFIFLVDEYMESHVAQFSMHEMAALRRGLEELHPVPTAFGVKRQVNDRSEGPAQIVSERLQAAISICKGFAEAITKYSHVVNASQSDHLELRSDIKNYLSYHLEQLEDNKRFAEQEHQAGINTKFETPRSSYPTWVHTVGAGHVSGPFSFSFLVCYMGGSVRGGTDCFSLKQKLVSYRMNWHIGAFCRMYNDYGSIVRDADECNINSVNFPEFFGNGGGDDELNSAKASLLAAAESERECAVDAAEVLYKNLESEGAAGRKIADHLRVYFGCCEQFSDMYITRDVTNRVK